MSGLENKKMQPERMWKNPNRILNSVDAVRIFVSNFDQAFEFYAGTLGLNPSGREPGSWLLFRLDNAVLLVEVVGQEEDEYSELVGRFTGISFNTGNIEEAHTQLSERGVRFDGTPQVQPWGQKLVHFHDPDDNVLTLLQ